MQKPGDRVGIDTTVRPEGDLEARRRQAALLTHDLRAALADVISGLRFLPPEILSGPAARQVDRSRAAGETLARLLDVTMSLFPSPERRVFLGRATIRLASLLDDLERRWTGRAEEMGLTLVPGRAAGLPEIVSTDRIALERIIGNLLCSAFQRARAGVVRLEVTLTSEEALEFIVSDQGPGFSAAFLRLLNDYRAQQAHEPASEDGIGLHIAHELADGIGGSLAVRNTAQGCSVVLCLPAHCWQPATANRADATVTELPDLSSFRILVAEDNPTNRLVLSQMLADLGARYEIVSDGVQALARLEAEVFDIAVIDVEMPRLGGLEVMEAVRARPGRAGRLPLVAMTAFVVREYRDRIYAAGATGIVVKPLLNAAAFGEALLQFFGKSRPGRGSGIASQRLTGADGRVVAAGLVDPSAFESLVDTIGPTDLPVLFERLLADLEAVWEGMEAARRAMDMGELRAQTHILTSLAGAVGAGDVFALAQRLNAAVHREDMTAVRALSILCLEKVRDLLAFLEAEQARRLRVA